MIDPERRQQLIIRGLYLVIDAMNRLGPEKSPTQIQDSKLLLDEMQPHNVAHEQLWARTVLDKLQGKEAPYELEDE